MPVLPLLSTESVLSLFRTGGGHARAVTVHAFRYPPPRPRRTITFRYPPPRRPAPRRRHPRRRRPRRDLLRYAKPPLHRFAATTVKALHIQETMCALQRLRAAGAFVFLRQTNFVGVAGKTTAPQLPLAVAQRAAPSFPIAAGMQTLAPARAMPFRSQGMTSAAALRPLTLNLLLCPLVTSLVPGAVARRCRPCCRRTTRRSSP